MLKTDTQQIHIYDMIYQLSLKKIVVDFINVCHAMLNGGVHEKYCKIAKLPRDHNFEIAFWS